jgi:hypothetical protein
MNKLTLIIFLMITFSHSVIWAKSPKQNKRGLIGVVNLYFNAKTSFKHFLYQAESLHAVNFLKNKTKKAYGSVVILSDKEATLEKFLEEMKIMASRDDIQVIDVIFDLHGHAGSAEKSPSISFVNETNLPVETSLVSKKLKNVSKSKLRALYSDACHGSKHNQDWIKAGFKVVAGSTRVDGNKSTDIRRFFKFWLNGKSFEESIDYANASIQGPIMDRLIDADSTKIMMGDGFLTIGSQI